MTERFDDLGVKIEVGDIIFSSPKGGGGDVGRVEKISDTGRITIKIRRTRYVYACERGAPDIKYMSLDMKRDEFGYAVRVKNSDPYGQWTYEYEEVERTRRDYSRVAKKDYWLKCQAAELSILVLAKGGIQTPSVLNEAIGQDFDQENFEEVPVAE